MTHTGHVKKDPASRSTELAGANKQRAADLSRMRKLARGLKVARGAP